MAASYRCPHASVSLYFEFERPFLLVSRHEILFVSFLSFSWFLVSAWWNPTLFSVVSITLYASISFSLVEWIFSFHKSKNCGCWFLFYFRNCLCDYVYACTKYSCLSARGSDWCKLVCMHGQVQMYMHTHVQAIWALARVIDESLCICMHKYGCLKARESHWCKLMYMHTQVQMYMHAQVRMFEC